MNCTSKVEKTIEAQFKFMRKLLSLGKVQIYLAFHSFNRNFVPR